MNSDSHYKDLEDVLHQLHVAGVEGEIRGDNASKFIYAERESRAVELSWDGVGVFIELWENSAENSTRDEQQDTYELATEQCIEWLGLRADLTEKSV